MVVWLVVWCYSISTANADASAASRARAQDTLGAASLAISASTVVVFVVIARMLESPVDVRSVVADWTLLSASLCFCMLPGDVNDAGVEAGDMTPAVGLIVRVVKKPWSLYVVFSSRPDDEEEPRGKAEDDQVDRGGV